MGAHVRQAFGIIGAVAARSPFHPKHRRGTATLEGARRGEHADPWVPSNPTPRLTVGAKNLGDEEVPVILFARLHPSKTPSEARERLIRLYLTKEPRVATRHAGGATRERVSDLRVARVVIREGSAAAVVAGLAGLVLLAAASR